MKKKILIVDPDETWIRKMKKILEDIGYDDDNIIVPVPVNTVWDWVQSEDFHVVVTEINFYKDDQEGINLMEKVKTKNQWTQVIGVVTHASFFPIFKRLFSSISKQNKQWFSILLKSIPENKFLDGDNAPVDILFTPERFISIVLSAIEFAERKRTEPNIFVAMPFETETEVYDNVYMLIEKYLEKKGKRVTKADKEDNIVKEIIENIQNASVVIANFSENKPNVFFEAGFAKALGKSIIPIVRYENKNALPDFLDPFRTIFYKVSSKEEKNSFLFELSDKFDLQEQVSRFKRPGNIKLSSVKKQVFCVTDNTDEGMNTWDIVNDALYRTLPNYYRRKYLWSDEYKEEYSNASAYTFLDYVMSTIKESSINIIDVGSQSPLVHYLAGFAYGINRQGKNKYRFIYRSNAELAYDVKNFPPRPIVFSGTKRQNAVKKISHMVQRLVGTDFLGGHILFMSANPNEQSSLKSACEFREIREEIQKSKFRDNLHLDIPNFALRARDFTFGVLNTDAQILHFSGQGSEAGELIFEDDEGNLLPAAPRVLSNLFQQLSQKIKCVILNACYSEKQAEAIAEHIDYVIGMRQGISDKAAIAFSIGFYQALGAGKTIEEAFQLGKIQSGLQNASEFETPVLLKRAAQKKAE